MLRTETQICGGHPLIEIELAFPTQNPLHILEQFCHERGLSVKDMHGLSKYPGCVHWHVCKDGSRGLFELTWWPRGERFWIKVAENRVAPWINEEIERLRPFTDRDMMP